MSQSDTSTIKPLITDHIDIWTSAILAKSTSGRGSSKKYELYGITKLRELILELAVRGKLVAQDANDEPASVLLEKIAAEKAKLIKEGKIKKSKPLAKIEEAEKPYELPDNWEWVRLGDAGISATGKTPKTSEPKFFDGDIPFIGPGQITTNNTILSPEKTLSEEGLEKSTEALENDILMVCIGGSIGKSAVVDRRISFNQQINSIRPLIVNYKFLLFSLQANNFYSRLINKSTGSATPIINRGKWDLLLVGLPPKEEQHRIVAKVDELMQLCDDLEQQTEASIDAHATLVEVLLTTLTDSANASELVENWARISEHFDSLFTTEQSIEALKQTILQLAVMGKLVPQDPDDEPASVLLEKIAAEKAQLVKEKIIKKEKSVAIDTDRRYITLPEGWEWCQLDNLSLSSEAGWSPKCEPTPKEGNDWGVLKVSAVTWGKYQPNENKALPKDLEPKTQYEVKDRDFLISRANTADLVARSVVVPDNTPKKLMMSDKIIRFNFTENIFNEYINLVNNTRYSRKYYADVAGGTSSSMKNVSRSQVRALNIALPPLAEQHRIVAKVDELMQICDQLAAKLQHSKTTQVQLTDALVEQALG